MKSKRILLFFVFFLSAVGSKAFSNAGFGFSPSLVLADDFPVLLSASFRSDKNPWSFFLNLENGFGSGDKTELKKISFFADDWFISERLAGHLDYFVLWGVSGGVLHDKNSGGKNLYEISTGCRFGAGLDFLFFKRHLEIFVQAAWNPYFGIKIDGGGFSAFLRPACFPLTSGIRFLF